MWVCACVWMKPRNNRTPCATYDKERFVNIPGTKMPTIIWWNSLCGNSSEDDAFWVSRECVLGCVNAWMILQGACPSATDCCKTDCVREIYTCLRIETLNTTFNDPAYTYAISLRPESYLFISKNMCIRSKYHLKNLNT